MTSVSKHTAALCQILSHRERTTPYLSRSKTLRDKNILILLEYHSFLFVLKRKKGDPVAKMETVVSETPYVHQLHITQSVNWKIYDGSG